MLLKPSCICILDGNNVVVIVVVIVAVACVTKQGLVHTSNFRLKFDTLSLTPHWPVLSGLENFNGVSCVYLCVRVFVCVKKY